MTDKIKLKADKFVNDKKLKLNYIKPKDLKLLLAEFCEEQIAELKAECDLAIEGGGVKIKELETQTEKMKCGGNCKHLYHVNTGGCYDAKCDLTYCDCINCKDNWELRR